MGAGIHRCDHAPLTDVKAESGLCANLCPQAKSEQHIVFRNAIPLFNLGGFEVRVDPSWLLIASLIIWSLSAQYFPTVLPDADTATHFALGVLGMLGLFGSLILHELSHSLVARSYGVTVGGITLFLFGGVAELTEEPKSARAEFVIAVAGPLASFAIAAVCLVLQPVSLGPAMLVLLQYLVFANTALAVFNLLPAFPMDGGRMLRAAIWHRTGDLDRATRIAAGIGNVFGLMLVGLGILSLLGGGGVGAFWLILIGFFIFSAARTSYSSAHMRSVLNGHTVGDLMSHTPITVDADAYLDHLVHEIMLPNNVSFVPVVHDGQLIGYIDKTLLKGIEQANWSSTRVEDVFEPVDDDNTLKPVMPAQKALERMLRTGARKYLVADRGRLLGVLSLADLLSYLSLKDALST